MTWTHSLSVEGVKWQKVISFLTRCCGCKPYKPYISVCFLYFCAISSPQLTCDKFVFVSYCWTLTALMSLLKSHSPCPTLHSATISELGFCGPQGPHPCQCSSSQPFGLSSGGKEEENEWMLAQCCF